MTPQFARKLLVLAIGILFLLMASLYQIQDSHPQDTINEDKKKPLQQDELSTRLRTSLLMQRKNFQRCWLQNSKIDQNDLTWQIFLTVESSGKVKQFDLLNKGLFNSETEKCLREIAYRLKFPTFEGEEFSFTIPIVISTTSASENR